MVDLSLVIKYSKCYLENVKKICLPFALFYIFQSFQKISSVVRERDIFESDKNKKFESYSFEGSGFYVNDDEDDEKFSEEEQNTTSAKIPKPKISTKNPRQTRESPDNIVIEQDDEDLVDFPIDYESEIEINYKNPKNSSHEKANSLFTILIITFMIKIFF